MSTTNTLEVIQKLQSVIHTTLAPLFPKSGKFALLDFPNYSNVGDSAIWLGALEYFRTQHKAAPTFVSETSKHYSYELKKFLPNGTIFIQGGGNFGDLWPHHQNFREQILQECKDYPVVQLPQSIHFQDPARLKESARIINAHPDFTLIVRDHKSLAIAKENFTCKIALCPDMAFALGALPKPIKASRDLLLLLRTDSEKVKDSAMGLEGLPQPEDWLDEDAELEAKIRRQTMIEIPFKLGFKALNKALQRELLFRRLAENRVERGLKQIASARFVITDRLHTHIMSLLLDVPYVALDNNYGKISNFIEAWTKDATIVQRAQILNDASKIYQEKKAA